MPHAALAAEAELKLRAIYPHLPRAQRGEAEGAVLARVFIVAYAYTRRLEQPHHAGEHFFARQAGEAQIVPHPAPDARQGAGELGHAAILRLVADFAPARMVAVLLAAARIAPGR